MDRYTRIQAINKVLKEYFEENPNQKPIPAKEFMGLFIKKGIFNQDSRDGLPIRKSPQRISQMKLLVKRELVAWTQMSIM